MDLITLGTMLDTVSGLLWSEYCLIPLLAGVGVYLTVGLRAFTWRRLGQGLIFTVARAPQ